jgi:RNA polymerase sigma-70 factor (ECF subfamily)
VGFEPRERRAGSARGARLSGFRRIRGIDLVRRIERMDPASHATARSELRALGAPAELQALIHAVAEGSQQALADLYERTGGHVFALALKLLKDRQLAEEVVLDVFLQVWKTAGTFDVRRGRPLGWMLTIARSRALDALRSRLVRRRSEDEAVLGASAVEAAPEPPERAHAGDRQGRVARAIAELPPDQARAVELAFFEGLSHTEIAERIGASLGTVKTRLRLGLLKLRDKLKRFEDER